MTPASGIAALSPPELGGPEVFYTFCRNIGPGSVELVAGIRPGEYGTSVWFSCQTDNNVYRTNKQTLPPGTDTIKVTHSISGLPLHSVYTYQVVLATPDDTIVGVTQYSDMEAEITTPKIAILSPESSGVSSVKLRALCDSHGCPTKIAFSYCQHKDELDEEIGAPLYVTEGLHADTVTSPWITGLSYAATYYVRAYARSVNHPNVESRSEIVRIVLPSDPNSLSLTIPITLTTSQGNVGTWLNFGVQSYASDCIDGGLGESELSPPSPAMSDWRFVKSPSGDGTCVGVESYVDLRRYRSPAQIDTYEVKMHFREGDFPLRLSWPDLDSLYFDSISLTTGAKTVNMKSSRIFDVEDPDLSTLTIIARGPRPVAHAPNVIINKPAHIGSTSAELNVSVNPNGLMTSAWFEWGATEDYGSRTPSREVSPLQGLTTVTAHLNGLAGGTEYHYRIVTKNPRGIYTGGDAAFVTTPEDAAPEKKQTPPTYNLYQNYPNPFNPRTVITYELPAAEHVTLKIYNVLGVELSTLVDEIQPAGVKSLTFDASSLTDGIYFYEITAGSLKQVRKMVVMR